MAGKHHVIMSDYFLKKNTINHILKQIFASNFLQHGKIADGQSDEMRLLAILLNLWKPSGPHCLEWAIHIAMTMAVVYSERRQTGIYFVFLLFNKL